VSEIGERLDELGIVLPEPMRAPAGVTFRFDLVRVHGDLAYLSGHGPVDGDRTLAAGKVGSDLDAAEAAAAARAVGLAMLASLRAEIGDLDRVEGWIRAFGMVNCVPGFNAMPAVINGFSELISEVWGPRGHHSRSAIGVAELPFDWPVEIEAVVALHPASS
jgi:enamine deaminase RidA (YjgF/YER057c/UK114 family)